MWKALPVPDAAGEAWLGPWIEVDPDCEIAGGTGHVIGSPVSLNTLAGSCARKRTATWSCGRPDAGTGGHMDSGWPFTGMRPNWVTSYLMAPKLTVRFAGSGQVLATKTAKHGGRSGG